MDHQIAANENAKIFRDKLVPSKEAGQISPTGIFSIMSRIDYNL